MYDVYLRRIVRLLAIMVKLMVNASLHRGELSGADAGRYYAYIEEITHE